MREDGRVPSPTVRSSVRLRPFALSVVAVSALLLSGCAGAGSDAPSPDASGAADLCAAVADSGAASEAATVTGEVGEPSKLVFDAPLEVADRQVTVVEEGDGDKVEAGDFVSYALTAFNPETGEEIATAGYEPGEMLPAQISADSPLGETFGCSPVGTRVVAAFPKTDDTDAEIYVLDLLSVVPTAAWGEPQEPVAGMPKVTLADDGAPTVTVPEGDLPTETTLATLKEGDGYEVQSGDAVLIQYWGVRWSNGESFDSTWAKGGVPYAQRTTSFVPGFQKALEGYPVGSQVLVVIPPVDGYGEGEINTTDLVGETLIFVVDILGAQHIPAQ